MSHTVSTTAVQIKDSDLLLKAFEYLGWHRFQSAVDPTNYHVVKDDTNRWSNIWWKPPVDGKPITLNRDSDYNAHFDSELGTDFNKLKQAYNLVKCRTALEEEYGADNVTLRLEQLANGAWKVEVDLETSDLEVSL